jgi:hypothetical protein
VASKFNTKQDVINDIKKEIISGTNTTNILTIDSTPGFGKTHHTIDAIVDICKNNPNHKILVVVPFGSKHPNASHIGDEINLKLGYNASMYVDSSNYQNKHVRLQIPFKQVVIITHARYLRICKSKNRNADVLMGRDTLIIDEKMVFADMITLTVDDLNKIINHAPSSIYNRIKMIVDILKDLISTSRGKYTIVNRNDQILNDIVDLEKLLKKIYSEEHQDDLADIGVYIPDSSYYLEMFMKMSHFFGTNSIVVNASDTSKGSLLTYNRQLKPILLKNNIMLSASARFIKLFENAPYVKMNTPIFNMYQSWILHIDNKKSGSRFANSFRMDLIPKYFELIQKINQPGDEILVVSSDKKEITDLEKMFVGVPGFKIHFTTFHNNVGTNNYSKCTKIVLMSLPKVSSEQAIIEYQAFENPELVHTYYDYLGKIEMAPEIINSLNTIMVSPLMTPLNLGQFVQRPNIQWKIDKTFAVKTFVRNIGSLHMIDLEDMGIPKVMEKIDLSDTNIGGVIRPKNERIREYKLGMMLDLMYQTIHRINRMNTLTAEIFMVNRDHELTQRLIDHMPGINVKYDISLDYDKKKRNYDVEKRKQKSNVFKLIAVIKELGPGTYEKAMLRAKIGMNDKARFSKIIKENDFVDYCLRNDVQISSRYIKVLK